MTSYPTFPAAFPNSRRRHTFSFELTADWVLGPTVQIPGFPTIWYGTAEISVSFNIFGNLIRYSLNSSGSIFYPSFPLCPDTPQSPEEVIVYPSNAPLSYSSSSPDPRLPPNFPTGAQAIFTSTFYTVVSTQAPFIETIDNTPGYLPTATWSVGGADFDLSFNPTGSNSLEPIEYYDLIVNDGIGIEINCFAEGYGNTSIGCTFSGSHVCDNLLIGTTSPSSFSNTLTYNDSNGVLEYVVVQNMVSKAQVGSVNWSGNLSASGTQIAPINPVSGSYWWGYTAEMSGISTYNGLVYPNKMVLRDYFNQYQQPSTPLSFGRYIYDPVTQNNILTPFTDVSVDKSGSVILEDTISVQSSITPAAIYSFVNYGVDQYSESTSFEPTGVVYSPPAITSTPTSPVSSFSEYTAITPDIYEKNNTNQTSYVEALNVPMNFSAWRTATLSLPDKWPIFSVASIVSPSTLYNGGPFPGWAPMKSLKWPDPAAWYALEQATYVLSASSDTMLRLYCSDTTNSLFITPMYYDLGPYRQFTFNAYVDKGFLSGLSYSTILITIGFWNITGIKYEWDFTLSTSTQSFTIDMFAPTRVIPPDSYEATNYATYFYPASSAIYSNVSVGLASAPATYYYSISNPNYPSVPLTQTSILNDPNSGSSVGFGAEKGNLGVTTVTIEIDLNSSSLINAMAIQVLWSNTLEYSLQYSMDKTTWTPIVVTSLNGYVPPSDFPANASAHTGEMLLTFQFSGVSGRYFSISLTDSQPTVTSPSAVIVYQAMLLDGNLPVGYYTSRKLVNVGFADPPASGVFAQSNQPKFGTATHMVYINVENSGDISNVYISELIGAPMDPSNPSSASISYGVSPDRNIPIHINTFELSNIYTGPIRNPPTLKDNIIVQYFPTYYTVITKVDGYLWYMGYPLYNDLSFYSEILSLTITPPPQGIYQFMPGSQATLEVGAVWNDPTALPELVTDPKNPTILISNLYISPTKSITDPINLYMYYKGLYYSSGKVTGFTNLSTQMDGLTTSNGITPLISTIINIAPGGFDIYTQTYGNPYTTTYWDYSRVGKITGYCGRVPSGPFLNDTITAKLNLVSPLKPVYLQISVGSDGTFEYDCLEMFLNNIPSYQNDSNYLNSNYKAEITYIDTHSIETDPNQPPVFPYTGYDPNYLEANTITGISPNPIVNFGDRYTSSSYTFYTPWHWISFGQVSQAVGVWICIPSYGYITIAYMLGDNTADFITYSAAYTRALVNYRGTLVIPKTDKMNIIFMSFSANIFRKNFYVGFVVEANISLYSIIVGLAIPVLDTSSFTFVQSTDLGQHWSSTPLQTLPQPSSPVDVLANIMPLYAQISFSKAGNWVEVFLEALSPSTPLTLVTLTGVIFLYYGGPQDEYPGQTADYREFKSYSLKPFLPKPESGKPDPNIVSVTPVLMQPTIVHDQLEYLKCYMMYMDSSDLGFAEIYETPTGQIATVLVSYDNGSNWLLYNKISMSTPLKSTYEIMFTGSTASKTGKVLMAMCGFDNSSTQGVTNSSITALFQGLSTLECTIVLYEITEDPSKANLIVPSVLFLDGHIGSFQVKNAQFGFWFDNDHMDQLFLVAIPFLTESLSSPTSGSSDYATYVSLDYGHTFREI